MSSEPEYLVTFGHPERQREFAERHIEVLRTIEDLKPAIDEALKNCKTDNLETRVLYTLVRILVEDDFNAILLLCANGYLPSAKVVLRAMFERTVTLTYLHKHPDEVTLFYEYFWIDRHKRLPAYIEEYGAGISQKSIEETNANFERIRDNYMVTACKKCKTKRLNHAWSKKDIVTMAKDQGFIFQIIETAYYHALKEAHPKPSAMFDRIEFKEDESMWYKGFSNLKDADAYLIAAQYLFFKVLEVMKDHFEIESLTEPISQAVKKMMDSWRENRGGIAGEST